MKMHLIHGIHASRKPATKQLAPHYRKLGFEVLVHNYGFALALPRSIGDWRNEGIATKIAGKISNGDIIVGHSNGCTVAHMIQKSHRHLSALILFQPALDNDVAFTGVDRVLVVYNELDDVVEQSRLARFSSWGNMGRVGYQGPSGNVIEWDSMDPPTLPPHPYSGHCGFVENGAVVLQSWAEATGKWALT